MLAEIVQPPPGERPSSLHAMNARPAVSSSPYPHIAPAGGDTATPLNLAKRLAVIQRYADVRGRRFLDCGCGAGDYVLALRVLGADAWGIEYSREKLAKAPAQVVGRVSVGDLHHIALRDGSVDMAMLNEVLEHVPDDRRALNEVHRVLKPGGILLIFSPNRRYPFETHGAKFKGSVRRIPHYVPFIPYIPVPVARTVVDFWARNYWPGQLRQLVRHAGFDIIHTDYVWQTFEGISNRQPAMIARTKGLLRALSQICERIPAVRTFGVSQVIVARKNR
jgi:ubiquinone/menaquinone biosynthesis C-methylase UbiE